MTKTIKDWLSELPEPYRKQALTNTLNGQLNESTNSLRDALMCAFVWDISPQGYTYWFELAEKSLAPIPQHREVTHVAILTRVIPATNTRPTRVKATGSRKIILPVLSTGVKEHQRVAAKLNPSTSLTSVQLPGGDWAHYPSNSPIV